MSLEVFGSFYSLGRLVRGRFDFTHPVLPLLIKHRAESHGAHHQLSGIPVHSAWRMVGGRQSDIARFAMVFPHHRHVPLTVPDTWVGMALVLGGIALCVHSKS